MLYNNYVISILTYICFVFWLPALIWAGHWLVWPGTCGTNQQQPVMQAKQQLQCMHATCVYEVDLYAETLCSCHSRMGRVFDVLSLVCRWFDWCLTESRHAQQQSMNWLLGSLGQFGTWLGPADLCGGLVQVCYGGSCEWLNRQLGLPTLSFLLVCGNKAHSLQSYRVFWHKHGQECFVSFSYSSVACIQMHWSKLCTAGNVLQPAKTASSVSGRSGCRARASSCWPCLCSASCPPVVACCEMTSCCHQLSICTAIVDGQCTDQLCLARYVLWHIDMAPLMPCMCQKVARWPGIE